MLATEALFVIKHYERSNQPPKCSPSQCHSVTKVDIICFYLSLCCPSGDFAFCSLWALRPADREIQTGLNALSSKKCDSLRDKQPILSFRCLDVINAIFSISTTSCNHTTNEQTIKSSGLHCIAFKRGPYFTGAS